MRKHIVWISIVLILGLYVFISAVAGITKEAKAFELPNINKKVALINIYGEIYDSTYVLRLLNKFSDMKSVKAIVLRINSPGGSPGASQEIYRQIIKTQEKGIKVVVSMADAGASGAYYIALPADKIYANPATLTGSIGVYLSFVSAEGLLEKIGVKFHTVKSGRYKNSGTFSREPTKKEIKLFGSLIRDVHDQFVGDVAESRYKQIAAAAGIKAKDDEKKKTAVKEYLTDNLADGRVLTGRQAKKAGLVDALGNIDDAIEAAAGMVGISGRPRVVTERQKMSFVEWIDSKLNDLGLSGKSGPAVKYLMK